MHQIHTDRDDEAEASLTMRFHLRSHARRMHGHIAQNLLLDNLLVCWRHHKLWHRYISVTPLSNLAQMIDFC